MKMKRTLCALLCAMLLCTFALPAAAADDRTVLESVRLESGPALLGEAVWAPALRGENDENFRLVSYQWYRGETAVAPGSLFEEGTYELALTLRVRNASKTRITGEIYFGAGDYLRLRSCTTDPDSGAVYARFSTEVLRKGSARITLPEIAAGDLVADALKNTKFDFEGVAPNVVTLMLYEDGELLDMGGFNGKGELIWTKTEQRFRAGSLYTLTALAVRGGIYVPQDAITVTNPGAADNLSLAGDDTGAGFTAAYLCRAMPTIETVGISGITAPVEDAMPDTDASRLTCAEPELYSVDYVNWNCDGPFEGGKTYEAEFLVIPAEGTRGLGPDTPVTFGGKTAEFVRETENGLIFRAAFVSKALPAIEKIEITGIIPPVEGAMPNTDAPLSCADPELYSVSYVNWICDGLFEGGQSYRIEILVTPLPGIHRLNAEQAAALPVTIGGKEARFLRAENGGFVYGADFYCESVPAIESIEIQGIPTPEVGEKPFYDSLGLIYGEPELYRAEIAAWTPEGPFEAGKTYTLTLNVIPLPGVKGPKPDAPATVNGIPAEYVGENEEGFVYRVSFTLPEIVEPLPFTDVREGDWFYPGVEACYRLGLMNGTSADRFTPANPCTRAMIVTILYRLEGSPDIAYTDAFSDVPAGKWYTDGILWAEQNGIVNGFGDGLFGPDRSITREQFAAILLRYRDYRGESTEGRADLSAFPDAGKVHTYARGAMEWAVDRGIIGGKKIDGVLCLQPEGSATRAECATILMRYCELE